MRSPQNIKAPKKLKIYNKTIIKYNFKELVNKCQRWEFRKCLSTKKLEITWKLIIKYNFKELVNKFKVENSDKEGSNLSKSSSSSKYPKFEKKIQNNN